MGICHVRKQKSTPKSTSFVPKVHGRRFFSSVQQLMCSQIQGVTHTLLGPCMAGIFLTGERSLKAAVLIVIAVCSEGLVTCYVIY